MPVRMLTGLKFFLFKLSSFLSKGLSSAHLSWSGKVLIDMELFTKSIIGYVNSFWAKRNNFAGMLYPVAFLTLIILSFLPEANFGLRVLSSPASVCVSVCVCVNHLLVRAITWDPFKLGSPNLDQRCKRPWLRSLLFWGAIDLDLQGQI